MTAVVKETLVIDVDTHVLEPADLWTSRVSVEKWGDLVPHVVWNEERGKEVWVVGDKVLGSAAAAAAAGWTDSPPYHPARLSDVKPELWDASARLKLMDAYGIHAQVLYPNIVGFGAGRFTNMDHELGYQLLAAYNDFLTDWSSVAPDRFLPVMGVPFWDIDLSIKEMERCAAAGHRGIIFSQAPESFGQPSLSDPYWDRLWAAAQEMRLPVNFHIGSSDLDTSSVSMLHPSAGVAADYASFPVTFFMGNVRTIATLIGGGICHRFPDLKFISVESGVGWVPFALQALDWMWNECRVTREHPEYELLPSEYFRRQIFGCFWFENGPSLQSTINYLGADNVLYETDFPHPTSMSPGPVSGAMRPGDFITEKLGSLGPDVLQKVLHDNAAKLYRV